MKQPEAIQGLGLLHRRTLSEGTGMKNTQPVDTVKSLTISEFSRASDTQGSPVTIGDALQRIKSDPSLVKMTARLRAADEATQKKLKRALPCVTWAGEFRDRAAAKVKKHSGLVCLDYDHLDAKALRSLQRKVAESPYVLAAFVSPRGAGLKVLFVVKCAEGASHKDAFRRCKRYSEKQGWPEVDKSGSDVSRLCFLPSDPKIHVKSDSVSVLLAKPSVEPAAANAEPGDDSEEGLLAALAKRVDGVDLKACKGMLETQDPSCGYEDWLNTCMAMHAQWHGTDEEDEARELFASWSAGELWEGDAPTNFSGPNDCNDKWESLGKRGAGSDVTMRSLIKRAKEEGYNVAAMGDETPGAVSTSARKELMAADKASVKTCLRAIKGASSLSELTGDVAKEITQHELFDTSRERIVEEFQAQYTKLGQGDKITKRAVDELIAFNYRDAFAKDGCPDWAAPYVFCREGEGSFINVNHMGGTKTKSFNMAYSSQLITDVMRAQGKLHPFVMPADLLVNADLVEKVEGVRYIPGEGRLCEVEGQALLNRWLAPEVTPIDQMVQTDEEASAVALWQDHLVWLLGEEHAHVLVQFLAYIVQNPGDRVRWAFLMKGPEGCGKTIIVESLMAAVIGSRNVAVLGNSTLMHTSFNSWQDSRQLCIVEEVYVEGRAKWDVMNILKPAITNGMLDIHPKGRENYQTRNVTSYIMSTNHADALPLVAGDRRYYVCAARWTGEEFINDLGGRRQAERYFSSLIEAAADHPGALLAWLQGVSLKGFNPTRAKMTASKADLMQASKSDLQVAVEGLLESGEHSTVTAKAIELETLKLALADSGEAPSGQGLSRLLRSMGYSPVGQLEMGRIGTRSGNLKSTWVVHGTCLDQVVKAAEKGTAIRALL